MVRDGAGGGVVEENDAMVRRVTVWACTVHVQERHCEGGEERKVRGFGS